MRGAGGWAAGLPQGTGGVVQVTGMLVVMAVDTQVLPVAAVQRIIVVVMVLMVHRKKMQIGARELKRTTAAHPRM